MPRVTVIIPSYNHAPYVRQAIDSVLSQSFSDLELLVNDDCSTDGTQDVVVTVKDPRLTLHSIKANNGASASVNDAIIRAKGEYIAILNSDDFFLPGKLAAQVRYLDENRSVGAVFGLPYFVDEQSLAIDPRNNPMRDLFVKTNQSRHKWLNRFFCIGNALCHPTVLIRRSCYDELGNYDARLAQLPDFDLWIRVASRHEIHILDQPLTAFRLLSGERNASAGNKVRHDFELTHVLQRYSALSGEELEVIFTDEFRRLSSLSGKSDPKILLGLLSLELGRSAWASSSYTLFGLNLLYNEVAKANCQMSFSEFMRLSGTHDAFNLAALSAAPQVDLLRKELQNMRNSSSWRLTAPIRNIKNIRKRISRMRFTER